MINEIVPISSEKRCPSAKAVVLETRVVTGEGGGPEKTIINTPRYMASYGYPTYCAYMHPPKDPGFDVILKRAENLGCPMLSIDDCGLLDRSVSAKLLEICREKQIGIWHGHDYKSNYLGLMLRKHHPMKLITTVHGWVRHTWKTPVYYLVDKWCLSRYDHVICVSHDLYEQCLRLGVKKERCSLIENAIDTMQYTRTLKVEEAKEKLGFPKDRFVVGACGRLSPEKNFAGLIRVTAELLEEGFPISLFIAGDGPIREALQKQIHSTGHADQIRLLGFRDDIMTFYQGLDLFVLNSLREGLPNVVLEAMAYEVPVLSTRVAGVPRLITNGYDGVLIDMKNEVELKIRLKTLLEDPDYRRMIGENGNFTIKRQYSFGVRMKKIRDIYDQLLGCDSPEKD
ncbi:MAG: glycosyltransferase family 4 protein [Thermoguttaceae bacterium]|nr:glycosyltransferase family 4 protein [Thermoguttaceae bacterium]